MARRPGHVHRAGEGDRLAVVERLELGELAGVLVDEVGELVHQLLAPGRGHLAPRPFERRLRRLDRTVDVLRAGPGDLADHVARRGIDGLERLAGGGLDPLLADQELVRRGLDEDAGGIGQLGGGGGSHPARLTSAGAGR